MFWSKKETTIAKPLNEYVLKDDVRKMVIEAVTEAVSPKVEGGYIERGEYFSGFERRDLNGSVEAIIGRRAGVAGMTVAREVVTSEVQSEAFLDKIITRIKDKQL